MTNLNKHLSKSPVPVPLLPFSNEMSRIAVTYRSPAELTIAAENPRAHGLGIEFHKRIWEAIRTWAASNPPDDEKSALRERIRISAFTRRGRKRGVAAKTKDQARELYDLLTPGDPVGRHQWLFARQWVEESSEEIEKEDFDYQKREERIKKLRADAVCLEYVRLRRHFASVRIW
jgi:hypothetical protein